MRFNHLAATSTSAPKVHRSAISALFSRIHSLRWAKLSSSNSPQSLQACQELALSCNSAKSTAYPPMACTGLAANRNHQTSNRQLSYHRH